MFLRDLTDLFGELDSKEIYKIGSILKGKVPTNKYYFEKYFEITCALRKDVYTIP